MHTQPHSDHEARESAELPRALIRGRRRVFLLVSSAPFAVYFLARLVEPAHDRGFAIVLTLAAIPLAIIVGAFALASFDSRIAHAADAHRAARRADRHPESVQPRTIVPPRKEPSPKRVHRAVVDDSRIRRRPADRARVHSRLESLLIAYLVLGFPILAVLRVTGGAVGVIAYVTFGFILLAITGRVDSWASEPIWTPGNANAQHREQFASARRWWSAGPPRFLRVMRGAFIAFVLVGFFACVVWPYLKGWAPDEKYPFAAIYIGGFTTGLGLLGLAERLQRRREEAWLKQRRSER